MIVTSAKTRPAVLLFLILLTGLLGSCLDIRTDLELNRRGDMTATITYILDERIADYGRGFGSDDPWPFPLTERDFHLKARMNEGVELRRYRSTVEKDGSERVTAVIRADSVPAMAAFLGLELELEAAAGEDSGSLAIRLPAGDTYAGRSAETREAIDGLIGDALIRFSIRPPSRPVEAVHGMVNGRTADFEVLFLDILYGRAPDVLKVIW